MRYDGEQALTLLRSGCNNPDARFREGQEEAIRHVVERRGRLLIVQRTGWGKSFVYFIATKLLREQGLGPALLVSPLLALMRNQIAAARRMGVRAASINSSNEEEWERIEADLLDDSVDVLLVSPERFANERFRSDVLAHVARRISLLVIDEAHCISDWGHDFRPHYRLLERIARVLPASVRLLATTATANQRVMTDLESVLGPGLTISRGDLNRSSLTLQTIRLPSQAERLAWLAEHLPRIRGHGIIYTLTVRDAEQVADWLRTRGLSVRAYTSQTGEAREALEEALLANEFKALVATTALGMGFDKPDLGFVIHYQSPSSVVAYYQQVGRAGRALENAYGILLSGEEEEEIAEYFIQSAFPSREEAKEVIAALEQEPGGLSVQQLMARVNLSIGRIQKTLDLLSLESPAPIARHESRWQLTAATLPDSFWERAERLTALRRHEKEQMQAFVRLQSGHMRFLLDALNCDAPASSNNALPRLPDAANPRLIHEALTYLRRACVVIEPRKIWPAGGMPIMEVRGRIAADLQAQPGRALCLWGAAGWGGQVRQGKYARGRFSDDLVAASANLVREWSPSPAPQWLTCLASARHPELLVDFTRRLAQRLALPFYPALERVDERPPQKAMENSVLQARNMDGALKISPDALPPGPVLLVDDIVDSRWTMTVAAYLLLHHGVDAVFPFALAMTGNQS